MSAGLPPAGVVTFLFTDIEGSTRRWEANAEAMRKALLAHDDTLRTAIEGHGGYIFSRSGDGVVAAFTSPNSAVDAAVAAQRALELPVRMGIGTGEAELRDGDYFGTVLNRAARVMAAGHGGQVLLTDSTAALLSDVDLVDLGPRRLRDVPNPVTVFQLRAPGLSADFPPLRTTDVATGNLRPQPTSLVGRQSELSAITTAMRAHRLVTLTGTGGVGKTRLALEVAAQLADEFADGVWVFELAAVSDPVAVPDAVAAVLGITQQHGKSVTESIADALAGRLRLLVFDNCEHVLEAVADFVEAILASSASIEVLATSREGLGVADEQLWPVPSLETDAAVRLFVERAQRVAPSFSIIDASAVSEICRRLDGIPLAIELAASRITSMAVDEIRVRLDDRFKLLVGSRRGLGRHQTLRHAVAWSYELLDETERVLLERCSVFAGGFDLESARAVGRLVDSDDYQVLDLLDALVRKSLLTVDRSSGRTRFSMLETIREFADEQLVARGDAVAARGAHARYFAERKESILALWDSSRQRDAYAWFNTELANLRSAFRWATDAAELDEAVDIATLAGFLGFLVETYEVIGWCEEVIESARSENHRGLLFLYQIASVCYMTGRIDAALGYVEGIRTLKSEGHPGLPFGIEGMAGGAYLMIGQPERTVEWCRSFLERELDTHSLVKAALANALVFTGATEEAMAAAHEIIPAAESTGNPWALSYALLSYGMAHRDADPIAALHAMRRGIAVSRDSGNRANESHLAHNMSLLEAVHGDPVTALNYLTLAIRNYHDAGSHTFIHTCLANLAALLDRLGHFESAATVAGFATLSPLATNGFPELGISIAHLRNVLGEQNYQALARKGEAMTTAEMVTFAYDQIDRARAEFKAASK